MVDLRLGPPAIVSENRQLPMM